VRWIEGRAQTTLPPIMKTQSIVLVLAGVLVGCGAGATVAASWAGPTAGTWECYSINEFPDTADAASTGNARALSEGLQRVAPSSPAGTVLPLSDGRSYVCAKN
jgi:hypothetical protein